MRFLVGGGVKNLVPKISKIIKNYTYYCTIFVVNFCTSFMNWNFSSDLDEHPYTQNITQNPCIVLKTWVFMINIVAKFSLVSLQNTYSFMLNILLNFYLGIPFSRTENIGYMIFRKRVWQKIQFRMQRCDFRTRCCGISNTCFSLWACLTLVSTSGFIGI